MNALYLDWRPSPTVSYSQIVKSKRVLASDVGNETWLRFLRYCRSIDLNPSWVVAKVSGFSYAYRSDGFIIYCADHVEVGASDRVNIACVIASFVKMETGHTHIFDRNSLHPENEKFQGPLAKIPVRLAKDLEISHDDHINELEKLLRDEKEFFELQQFGNVAGSAEPIDVSNLAIIRLRNNYSRLFDRTVAWCTDAKASKKLGIPIFRRSYFFALIYVVVVFCLTVFEFQLDGMSGPEKLLLLTGALVSSASFALLLVGISALFRMVMPFLPIQQIRHWLDGRDSHLNLWVSKVLKRLSLGFGVPDILLLCFVPGIFLFPMKEIPNFFGLIKRFNLSTDSAIFSPAISMQDQASIVAAQSTPAFESALLAQLSFYSFAPLLLVYFIDVSGRRRKIVTAYRNLLGHLAFGNILDATIDRTVRKYNALCLCEKRVMVQHYVGYSDAMSLIRDRLIVEQITRNSNRLLLIVIFCFCFWYSFDEYWNTVADLLNFRGFTTPVDRIIFSQSISAQAATP